MGTKMAATKGSQKNAKSASVRKPSEISSGIFVGGWKDAVKFEGERFCVLDEAPDDMPTATHIPIYNEGEDRANIRALDRLVASVQAAHKSGKPVLIFCGYGHRRSPLGGAWYLRRMEGVSLDEAYDRIRKVRPTAEPASAWVGNASELDSSK